MEETNVFIQIKFNFKTFPFDQICSLNKQQKKTLFFKAKHLLRNKLDRTDFKETKNEIGDSEVL